MADCARRFDYASFKAELRAAALKRGIDPIEGATSYQAALVQAEQRTAAVLAAPDYGWWQRERSIFSEADERRPTERVAFHQLEYLDDEAEPLVPLDADAIRELWREIRREVVDRSVLPLRTLHAHQLAWAEAAAEADREFNEKRNAADRQRRAAKRLRAAV